MLQVDNKIANAVRYYHFLTVLYDIEQDQAKIILTKWYKEVYNTRMPQEVWETIDKDVE